MGSFAVYALFLSHDVRLKLTVPYFFVHGCNIG